MSFTCAKQYTIEIEPAAHSLLGYFKLDEIPPVTELINSENATYNIPEVWPTEVSHSVLGKIGNAMGLGIDDDEKTWTSVAPVWRFTGDFTLRFWVLVNSIDVNWSVPIDNTQLEVQIYTLDSGATVNLAFNILMSNPDDNVFEEFNISFGNWHRFVVRLEGGVALYMKMNNDPDVVIPVTSASMNQGFFPQITIDTKTTSHGLNGGLDELAIWTRKLTDAELLYDWNSGNGRTYPDVPLV